MININIEVRPKVKPIVFNPGTRLSKEEKKKTREFFKKHLWPVLRDTARRE